MRGERGCCGHWGYLPSRSKRHAWYGVKATGIGRERKRNGRNKLNASVIRGYREKLFTRANPKWKESLFLSFSVILNITFQGRLRVPIVVPFIRIRPETALIHHYRPCAEYEMKVARRGDVPALIRNSITGDRRSGFSERESRERYWDYKLRLLGAR